MDDERYSDHDEDDDEIPLGPWTMDDYETLQRVVLLAVRSMMPISLDDGTFYAGIEGPIYWDLLCALDRQRIPRPRPGRPRGR